MRIKYYVSTNKDGSKCEDEIEIEDEDWECMSDVERNEYIFECMCDSGLMSWGYEEPKGGE